MRTPGIEALQAAAKELCDLYEEQHRYPGYQRWLDAAFAILVEEKAGRIRTALMHFEMECAAVKAMERG